jgi:hypothetical protein
MTNMNKPVLLLPAVLMMVLAYPALQVCAESYDALLPLLVDLPGWEADPANGEEWSSSFERTITSFRTYTSGGRGLRVGLQIGKNAGRSGFCGYNEGFQVQTPKTAGFQLFHTFDPQRQTGIIAVLLNDSPHNPEMNAVLAIEF